MNNTKILFLISGLFAISITSYSQEVIAVSGNTFENSSVSVSFTIGEPITVSLKKDDLLLTHGFHQAEIIIETEFVLPELNYEISVFPNPAHDFVIIKTDQTENLQYRLYTLDGRQIGYGLLDFDQTEINFSLLNPSVYFLKVIDGNKELKTFKIIKK